MKEPREFKLRIIKRGNEYNTVWTAENAEALPEVGSYNLIEKSAYDSLRSQLDIAKAALELIDKQFPIDYVVRINEIAREALKQIEA